LAPRELLLRQSSLFFGVLQFALRLAFKHPRLELQLENKLLLIHHRK
jgi:hypothetical protein